MSGERMRAEMAEQPDALRRLVERFDDQVTTVRGWCGRRSPAWCSSRAGRRTTPPSMAAT